MNGFMMPQRRSLTQATAGLAGALQQIRQRKEQAQLNKALKDIYKNNTDPSTGELNKKNIITQLRMISPEMAMKQSAAFAKEDQAIAQQAKTLAEVDYKQLQSEKLKNERSISDLRMAFDDKSWQKALKGISPELAARHPYYDSELKDQLQRMMMPKEKSIRLALQKQREDRLGKAMKLKEESLEIARQSAEARKKRAETGEKRFERYEQEQDINRATKAAKNTKNLYSEILVFKEIDKELPGGLYGTGGISGFGFGTKPLRKFWKTKEANSIRGGVSRLVNVILKERSGAAVTDQEFDRLEQEFGIGTTGTIDEFRRGLQRQYEATTKLYDRYRKADPQAFDIIEQSGDEGFKRWLQQDPSLDYENMSDEDFEADLLGD